MRNLLWLSILFFSLRLLAADESRPYRDHVTVDGIRQHQLAFQHIADQNHGNRAAGTSGFRQSVLYVKEKAQNAGLQVRLQDFPITLSEDNSLPALFKTVPDTETFVANVDFLSMSAIGYAEVTAPVEAIDLKIPSPAPNTSNSGCEMDDFKNFTRGHIALIQRGTCSFKTKVENAISAGAVGVILFNEGNPGRIDAMVSRLPGSLGNFPVLSARYVVGESLCGGKIHGPTGASVHMRVDVASNVHMVQNVIAETASGDANRVIVIGAHLDGVREGPGMNDNGSGSATILRLAESFQALKLEPKNKLRFIWFAAEELGLLGSEAYVLSLTRDEQDKILAMINLDMIGSPNYARFVYDGDSSPVENISEVPKGSAEIEQLFLDYFAGQNLITHPTAFDGRSDYGPFIEVGIPAGGLFSGAEGIKSPRMQQIYGGFAHEAFDPCYHRSCDTYEKTGDANGSLGLKSLNELSDAAAHVVFNLAKTDANLHPKKGVVIKTNFEYRGGLLVK